MTLSHRAQVKRFTSDLLRILKAQASKQVRAPPLHPLERDRRRLRSAQPSRLRVPQMTVSQFPVLYEKTLSRPFDARDYGVCELSDLIGQVAEASVVVVVAGAAADGHDAVVALPKREQTFDEMERTKQFAVEVLLYSLPSS